MVEAYHILRYGVIIGLVILIVGFLVSFLTEITTILWIGIYVIISTPISSIAVICAGNIKKKERRILGLLALLEILVIVIYILVAIHAL